MAGIGCKLSIIIVGPGNVYRNTQIRGVREISHQVASDHLDRQYRFAKYSLEVIKNVQSNFQATLIFLGKTVPEYNSYVQR
jgi:cobalamin biosynthesis Co2+ chelatase CbiK